MKVKGLKTIKKKHSGRDASGQVVVRHQGGQHKRYHRRIDFKRDKTGIVFKVIAIEYEPNRTCDIALIPYSDGEIRYILAPQGLTENATIASGRGADVNGGNSLPVGDMPAGT